MPGESSTIGIPSESIELAVLTLHEFSPDRSIPSKRLGRHWCFRRKAVDGRLGQVELGRSEWRGEGTCTS